MAEQDTVAAPAADASKSHVKLEEPLAFWIGFLILGIVLNLVFSKMSGTGPGLPQLATFFTSVSNDIIYIPGVFVFPLVVAIWIGERVSKVVNSRDKAMRTALINASYTALIYAITIFVLYLILYANDLGALMQPAMVVTLVYAIVIPIAILLVLTTVFAMLAYERRAR